MKDVKFIILLVYLMLILRGANAQETVSDIDGTEYATIVVAGQRWMAENLRVARYNNGDSITYSADDQLWMNTKAGLTAWYDNNETNDLIYGKLYNWYAVADNRGICPEGWRVPTSSDWQQLNDSIDPAAWGNNNFVGTRLKSRRQVDSPLNEPWDTDEHPRWDSHPKRYGTDDYGFSVMPGGSKDPINGFMNIGTYAYFWTSSSNSLTHAWVRTFLHSHKGSSQSAYQKNRGLSIRCVFGEPVIEYNNNMMMVDVSAQPGESILIEVSLANEQPIHDFALEFQLPLGFTYIGNSFQLTDRSTNHNAVATVLPGNLLSLTATSETNDAFSGNNGVLFSFLLATPALEGDWVISADNIVLTGDEDQSIPIDPFQTNINLTQGDKEFWFAVPKVSEGHGWIDRRFYIRLTNSDLPSNVSISMPANPGFVPIAFPMQANEARTVDITADIENFWVENPNVIYNNGVLIESGNPTNAYFEIGTHLNPDIFALKGKNAMGRDFFVPFQTVYDNGNYTPKPYSAIYIVATEDNTFVTITPSKPAFPGRPANVPFNIVLNRGQTFAVAPDDYSGTGQLAENRLAGTRVQASRPVAILTSDDSIGPTCKDLVGDQLVPVNAIGSEYITTKGRLSIPEYFYVLGTNTNEPTEVFVDGIQQSMLASGEQLRFEFTSSNHFVAASSPVYLYHVSGFGCEMGGALIPPVDLNTGSNYVSFTRSKGESFFLNILVKAGAQDGFILTTGADKQEVEIDPASFSAVPGSDDWLVGEFEFSSESVIPVGQPSLLRNTKDVFHLGIINGGPSSGTMYGYFSAFRTFE